MANISELPRLTVKETRKKTWGNRHVGQFIAESLVIGLGGSGEKRLEIYKQGLREDIDFERTRKAVNLVVDHEEKNGIKLKITSLPQVRDAAISWIEYYQSLKLEGRELYLSEIRERRLRKE